MKLLVGLGNAGTKFSLNRHNIGYILIDNILQNYCFSDFKKKGKSYLTKGIIGDLKVILLKPNTFMNNSGESVSEIKEFYNIKNNDIFVFHDEIDLSFSFTKIKNGGGNNGHNGLKSIDKLIGSNYNRIRFGVGRPFLKDNENKNDIVSKWVLSNFTNRECKLILEKATLISKNINDMLLKEFDKFIMNIN